MELKQFVKEALVQVAQGVAEAQKELTGTDAKVNPAMRSIALHGEKTLPIFGTAEGDGSNPVHLVEFDVAVTAEEGTTTKGGIGVVAGMFTLGSQGQSDKSNAAISRIKFRVPLMLPSQK